MLNCWCTKLVSFKRLRQKERKRVLYYLLFPQRSTYTPLKSTVSVFHCCYLVMLFYIAAMDTERHTTPPQPRSVLPKDTQHLDNHAVSYQKTHNHAVSYQNDVQTRRTTFVQYCTQVHSLSRYKPYEIRCQIFTLAVNCRQSCGCLTGGRRKTAPLGDLLKG